MSEENKAVVRRFHEAVNARNLDVLDEIFVEDYVHHDPALPPEMQRGREAYKQGIGAFHSAFPDLHGTLEDVIAEGEKVASRLTWRGTHQGELQGIPPTGHRVEFSMISVHRIAGGKTAEGWVNFDAMGMMQQLGVIPEAGQTEEASPT